MTSPLPNFDRIARPYRWLEYLTLGPILQRTRTRHLQLLTHRKQALILGDGDGRFTATLLAGNPTLQAEAVDLSRSMLTLLRRRADAAGAGTRLQTHHADARTFVPTAAPDLVVTHFFLDCLTQPEVDALIGRLTPLLHRGSLWLVSDFRIPSGLLQLPARLYVRPSTSPSTFSLASARPGFPTMPSLSAAPAIVHGPPTPPSSAFLRRRFGSSPDRAVSFPAVTKVIQA